MEVDEDVDIGARLQLILRVQIRKVECNGLSVSHDGKTLLEFNSRSHIGCSFAALVKFETESSTAH